MRNLLQNKKRLFLIVLVLLAIVSIIFIYIQSQKRNVSPVPTPIPLVFQFIRSVPPSGPNNILPTSAIEFQFSKPIDSSNITINIKPFVAFSFDTSADKKILYVKANPMWKEGVEYQITINAKSADGETMPEKVVFTMTINKMTDSNLTE